MVSLATLLPTGPRLTGPLFVVLSGVKDLLPCIIAISSRIQAPLPLMLFTFSPFGMIIGFLLIGLFSLWVIAASVYGVVILHIPTWTAQTNVVVVWCSVGRVGQAVVHFAASGASFGFVVCLCRVAHLLKTSLQF